jgi:hypothetical protein
VIDADGAVTTQRELLAAWREDTGVLGLRRDDEITAVDDATLGAVAARPLVTGAGTVLVKEAVATDRVARGERVARWR